MEKIIYFDYCALIIFSIILLSALLRRMTKSKANQLFIVLTAVCIATSVADIIAVHLDMMGSGHVVAKYIFHTMYLFLHSLLSPVYIIYLIIRTDTIHKFKENIMRRLGVMLPISALAIMLIANLGWHFMFYLDENDTYTRGEAFPILYIIGFYYAIIAAAHLCKYRKTLAPSRFIALVTMIPLMIVAVIIQFVFKNVLVEMFANACGILFIGLMIQRPEERIDSETGLEKLSAYVSDVKRAFFIKKPLEIIMVNIVNYDTIQDMLGYDGTKELKTRIVEEMITLNKKYKLKADLYYLNNGKFSFVVSGHSDQIDIVAVEINQFMKKGISLKHLNLNLNLVSWVCITRCPEDIGDIDSLLVFGNDMNLKNYDGGVMYAAQGYKKEYYDIMKDIDRIIEYALVNHTFSVYYQPIFSVKESRFLSAEALLRLHDDKYGFIPPDVVIEAAEKSGTIHRVGEYVIEEVCKFIASDEFAKLGLDYIEINLSVVQCMQKGLAQQVLDILKKYNVRPDQINLEITETASSYSQNTMMENLNILSEAGIYFSLDDFGTGYSNMKRIASMPFELVKLDKSFTDVEDNPRLMIVLKNTIDMIKAMNMQIVVEGVETEHLAKQFSDLQCEYIQGYYYSRPVPQNEFIRFIEEAKAE